MGFTPSDKVSPGPPGNWLTAISVILQERLPLAQVQDSKGQIAPEDGTIGWFQTLGATQAFESLMKVMVLLFGNCTQFYLQSWTSLGRASQALGCLLK